MEDWRLLKDWVEDRSEAAFAALVNRHLNLVYSAALRRVRDHQAAEEVAQSVFCLLAKNARRLGSDTALVSWLYRTTCFKASRVWRAEQRRRLREQKAISMNSINAHDHDELWQELAPRLEDAMQKLDEEDRVAVLLRFFQGKAWREIGSGLGIAEDAARMRVNRAIERLRDILREEGVACSGVVLGAVLSDKLVHVAPPSLLNSVQIAGIATAKAGSGAAGLVALFGTLAKAKLAAVLAGALALLLGLAWVVHAQRKPPSAATVKTTNSLGPVSFSFRSLRLDPSGYVAAIIAITNEGKFDVDYASGVQILTGKGWAHTNGNINQSQVLLESYTQLEGGEERLLAVRPPAFAGSWRAFVTCKAVAEPWKNAKFRTFSSQAFKPIDSTATNQIVETTNTLERAAELEALGRSLDRQYRRAAALFDEAIHLNPCNALYYLNRAEARRHLHNMAGALADLDRTIELSSARPNVQKEARSWKADWSSAVGDQEYEKIEK